MSTQLYTLINLWQAHILRAGTLGLLSPIQVRDALTELYRLGKEALR